MEITMKAKRKKVPQPPKWYSCDSDECWECKNRYGCHNCKYIKSFSKKLTLNKKWVK